MYHSYSFHPQDEEDIIIKYVNGKGRVGIFIQSKDDNISSVVNEENLDFDDLEYQYWDDAQEVTVTNDQFFFSEKEIKRAVINTVAASFNKKGYSHPSVMWALWNMPGSTWVCPVSKENNYEEEKRKKEIRQRVESLKIKKMCQSLVNTFGETAVRKVTFTGSDGEDYGYMIYDLLTGTKCGVEVTCWGSEQYGGNCRCINHDPSHDIDQTEMSVEDIKKVEELLSKENNSGDEINTQTTKQDQDKSYYDKITVNDVKISIGWIKAIMNIPYTFLK